MSTPYGFGKQVALGFDQAIERVTAVFVEFMDPVAVLQLVDNPNIEPLAATVRGKLDRVMQAI